MTGLRHSGADVRIAWDGRVWVVAPATEATSARWTSVGVEELRLDADWPGELISPHGRHPLADLGMDIRQVGAELGLPRRDPRRVADMAGTRSVLRLGGLLVDPAARELALHAMDDPEALVWPFTAFEMVVGEKLIVRPGGRHFAAFIPMDSAGAAAKVAELIGAPRV